jgi:hypothetical protein
MNTLLLFLLACEEKTADDTGFFDIDIDDTDTNGPDTNDTSPPDTSDTNDPGSSSLEIIGSYADSLGDSHTIDEELWTTGSGALFSISQYDNNSGFLIAQNDASNAIEPERWSKFQWTINDNGGLYYCQSISDAATEEDAMGANADPADLGMGCIGSPWVELRLNMDLDGDFVDNNGQPHTINAFLWVMGTAPSLFHIAEYSNDDDYALAQNDAANESYAGLYSKFEWTQHADGAWFYCQSIQDAASLEDAKNGSVDTDLDTGCNGLGWSEMTPTGNQ